jgi:hypothetical protein
MTTVNERLKALQITLPEAPPVVDVSLPPSLRLCAPAISSTCRDASQKKMASLGPANLGSKLPPPRASKPHLASP